jgi:hypothetical protein
MTLYNVHLYREMRLFFPGIEAETPEAAAANARDRLTEDADDIRDCDGEDLGALVDVVGDDQYEQSLMIDFEAERLRKASPELREAIPPLIGLVHRLLPKHAQSDSTLDNLPEVIRGRAAIAKAATIENQPKRSDHYA